MHRHSSQYQPSKKYEHVETGFSVLLKGSFKSPSPSSSFSTKTPMVLIVLGLKDFFILFNLALLFPHAIVHTLLCKKIAMSPLLYDLSVIQHNDIMRVRNSRKTMGNNKGCLIFGNFIQVFLNFFFCLSIEEEVASSNKNILGFFRRVRAMATLCFSPPDNFNPRSPTMVSYPSGSF